MKEADLMRAIQIRVTEMGHRVFRNNVGVAQAPDGSVIRYGLAVGSSDLIGWTRLGRFLAIEVKTPTGRATKEQLQFLVAVNKAGGVGLLVRSVEELYNEERLR